MYGWYVSILTQKTLANKINFSGIGIHTGVKVNMTVMPASPNSGIIFKRTDLNKNNIVVPLYNNVTGTNLCTTISNEYGVKVSTIEHLMGAFYGAGIDNAIIEIDSQETPILDGSAKCYIEAFKKVGLKLSNQPLKIIKINKKIVIEDNEKFISNEIGGEYRSDKVAIKGSYYNTQWKDRNLTKSVTTGQGDSGDTDIIYLTGVDQSHSGFEIESKVALHEMVDLDVAVSIGDWYFDGDAKGDYTKMEYNENNEIIGQTSEEYEYALANLKVGDMPQTSYVGGLTVKPIKGLSVQGLYRWYDNHYADWSPDCREVEGDADRAQVWKTTT